MKNLILQHWTGDVDQLGKLSSANIQKYAEGVGAEYQFLRGDYFTLTQGRPSIQKLHALNEVFDDYDVVLMLDADMFTRKGMTENIFDDKFVGVGKHVKRNGQLHAKMHQQNPRLTDLNYPYWGGSVYRLTRDMRRRLREQFQNIAPQDLFWLANKWGDEGTMHRLATLAKVDKATAYLPGKMWSHGNYEEGIEESAVIHVRYKYKIHQNRWLKRTKMENYQQLIDRGLIEE